MTKPNHMVEPEELMAYLDGELSAEQALDTAAHLEHCRECQKLAAELKEVSEMLVAWEVEEVEEGLPDRIASELDKGEHEKPASSFLKRWPRVRFPTRREMLWRGGLAATALIIFLIVNSNLRRNPSSFQYATEPPSKRDGLGQAAMPLATPPPADAIIAHKYPAGGGGGRASAGKLEGYNGTVNGRFNRGQSEVEEEEAQESAVDSTVDLKSPMIIRTADLAVTVKNDEFDKARAAIDEILKRYHGHVADLTVNTPTGSARSLTGTLRVPSNQLDAAMADLKVLGRVEKELQSGEEVTQQYVDLQARLANSKHTEQRLTEILRERTGKLSDVLAVEMQISRVRGEIEQMEAQRKTMKNQVDFATLNLTVSEDYKKELTAVPPSTGTQFRNAAVEGYRSLVDGIIAVLLWFLSVGPTLLLWAAILFFPLRIAWRKVRSQFAKQ